MGAQSATRRGDASGTPAGIVTPDAIDREARGEFAQFFGRVRLEHRLQPLVVLVDLQVALGERLTE